jgi:hypothetical protein
MSSNRSWIFLGNPNRFDVDAYLERQRRIMWTVNPRRAIDVGDRAFMWRADGKQKGTGGVVAVGWVEAKPEMLPDDAPNLWRSTPLEPFLGNALRIRITLDDVRLTPQEGMLLRLNLETVPELSGL